mmetsp:Transcript_2083/g.4703  ORF Transcript_2083/g.4703 Transcript_2083/m.4703 type:complete len:135 (+) Transcript_2083:303-707(+)
MPVNAAGGSTGQAVVKSNLRNAMRSNQVTAGRGVKDRRSLSTSSPSVESTIPSDAPSLIPSIVPSVNPSSLPSRDPSVMPTAMPSVKPSLPVPPSVPPSPQPSAYPRSHSEKETCTASFDFPGYGRSKLQNTCC